MGLDPRIGHNKGQPLRVAALGVLFFTVAGTWLMETVRARDEEMAERLGVDLSKPPQRGITQEQLDRLKAIGASRESAERALREALDARQREARGELDRQKRA